MNDDDLVDVLAPFGDAEPLQSLEPQIALVGAVFVREMPQLHRHELPSTTSADPSPVPSPGTASSPAVAAQGLHRSVVDDLHGTAECLCEIEVNPAVSQVDRFGNRLVVSDPARDSRSTSRRIASLQ